MPKVSRSRLVLLCFVCTLGPSIGATGVRGQSVDSLQTVIQRAHRSNWTLQIKSPVDTLIGRVSFVTDDTIAVGSARIAVLDIDDASRHVVDEKAVVGGAVIGGVILGVVGYNLLPCSGDYNCGDASIMMGGLGVALGSLIGAFAGKSVAKDTWRPLWTSQ